MSLQVLEKDKIPAHKFQDSIGFYSTVHISILCDDDDEFFAKTEFPEELIQKEFEEIKDEYEDEDEAWEDAVNNLRESLGYWIYYFIPRGWEEREEQYIKTAIEVGLIPFYFRSTLMLALGGAGMDLSPKLDAFQVLVAGTIPPDSILFRDPKYFKYVVGEEVFKKVIDRLTSS